MENAAIPPKEECLDILNKNKTPSNVIEHCKTVCKLAEDIAEQLIKRDIKVNKQLVIAAALLHDIERVKPNHIVEGTKLIKNMGFPEVSEVVKKHGLYKLGDENVQPSTVEEKILFYADKSVIGNKIVGVKKRIEDLEKRYNKRFNKELECTKKIEEEVLKK